MPDSQTVPAGDPPPETGQKKEYVFALFISGPSPLSRRAIVNTRQLCEEHLSGSYSLEIVDLSLNPGLAVMEQIVAAPTLLMKSPPPARRFVGDMSRTGVILRALGRGTGATPPR